MTTVAFTPSEWDQYAKCYDALTELRPYHAMVVQVVAAVPAAAHTVLDLGCGTGTLLKHLYQERTLSGTGIDSSLSMLAIAREKLVGFPVTLHQYHLETGQPWSGPYDCVVTTNVLYTLNEPEAFLKRIYEVLNPSGTLLLVTPKADYDNGLILKAHCQDERDDDFWRNPHQSSEREHALITTALGTTPLAKKMKLVAAYNRRIAGTRHFHFYEKDELVTLLQSVGFKNIVLQPIYAHQNFFVSATKE